MKLSENITSLNSYNTVAELSQMLKRASISALGNVQIDGYEGSVHIDEIVRKYLEAAPFQRNSNVSFEDRLACHQLRGRFQQLYSERDSQYGSTLGKLFSSSATIGPEASIFGIDDERLTIKPSLMVEPLYEIPKGDLKRYFSGQKPVQAYGNNYIVSQEMMDNVSKQEQPSPCNLM